MRVVWARVPRVRVPQVLVAWLLVVVGVSMVACSVGVMFGTWWGVMLGGVALAVAGLLWEVT